MQQITGKTAGNGSEIKGARQCIEVWTARGRKDASGKCRISIAVVKKDAIVTARIRTCPLS